MKEFLTVLNAEHYKIKKIIEIKCMFLFPFLLTLFFSTYYIIDNRDAQIEVSFNPWVNILGRWIFPFYALLFPLLTAIFTQSLRDMELKERAIILFYTLPVKKFNLFAVKIIVIFEVIFIAILIAYACFFLAGYCIELYLPGTEFSHYDVRQITFVYFYTLLIGTLSVAYLQFFMSLLFKNFILPLGIACIGVISCYILWQWKYIPFIPYYCDVSSLQKYLIESPEVFDLPIIVSIIYIVSFILLAGLKFFRIKL